MDTKMQFAQDFFDLVRGKKIRWTGWPETYYFIPFELLGNQLMQGDYFEDVHLYSLITPIGNGFAKDTTGRYWEYCEKQQRQKIKNKCFCDTWVLFNRGCQCGAFQRERSKNV